MDERDKKLRHKIGVYTEAVFMHSIALAHGLTHQEAADRIMEIVLFDRDAAVREASKVNENTSDGYHTFKELYEYRMLYNAALFNSLKNDPNWGHGEHKSKRHSDGELCFGGGWFIVVATLPTGQISNHYEMKDWHLFNVEEREIADKWDGHTPKDVAKRIRRYLEEHT
jgi:hypothetical protein